MVNAGRHTLVPDDVSCFVDLEIGAFCSIASGLKIVSGQHPGVECREAISNFPFHEHGWGMYPQCRNSGRVVIDSDVWIGQDVSIMAGVYVAPGAVLGAGAMVTKDVAPYTVVAGNPARPVRRRFTLEQAAALLGIAWWRWPDEKIAAALPAMADIDAFLEAHRGS